MIRLLVAIVGCVALHSAAPAAHAHEHERTIAVAGGEQATPPVLGDAGLDGAALFAVVAVAPRSLGATSLGAAPRSFCRVARLWLRAQRLLC